MANDHDLRPWSRANIFVPRAVRHHVGLSPDSVRAHAGVSEGEPVVAAAP